MYWEQKQCTCTVHSDCPRTDAHTCMYWMPPVGARPYNNVGGTRVFTLLLTASLTPPQLSPSVYPTRPAMAVQGSRTRLLKRLPTRMLSSALEEPIFQSYLFKQSHIFDAFNKRYFILFQGYLVYYVSEEEYKSDHKHGHLAVSRTPIIFPCLCT